LSLKTLWCMRLALFRSISAEDGLRQRDRD
jgi:hypothetical protein